MYIYSIIGLDNSCFFPAYFAFQVHPFCSIFPAFCRCEVIPGMSMPDAGRDSTDSEV